jgi:hypothetical protein
MIAYIIFQPETDKKSRIMPKSGERRTYTMENKRGYDRRNKKGIHRMMKNPISPAFIQS